MAIESEGQCERDKSISYILHSLPSSFFLPLSNRAWHVASGQYIHLDQTFCEDNVYEDRYLKVWNFI